MNELLQSLVALRAALDSAIRSLESSSHQTSTVALGVVLLDCASRTATRSGVPIAFTPTELGILWHLIQHRGAVRTRAEIMTRVYGADFEGDDRTIDTHIASLRRKLGDPKLIRTVHGIGYRLIP